jgi:hypothetical protein
MEEIQETTRQLSADKPGRHNHQTWEMNHQKIVDAIQNLIKRGDYPTQEAIAKETAMSRITINKHFNKANERKVSKYSEKIMRMLKSKIAMKVCIEALEGDPKAIKLYNDMTTPPEQKINNHFSSHQTNIIQYHGMVINDKTLQNLPPDKQILLENVLKSLEDNNDNRLNNDANNTET